MDVGEEKRKLILMKNLSYITSYVHRGKSTENLASYMLYINITYIQGHLKGIMLTLCAEIETTQHLNTNVINWARLR